IHSSHERRWQLALTTLRAVTVGLQEQESVERYGFLTREMLPLQLDGELIEVPADSELVVESAHQAVQVIG
ncbi:MAG TPA: diacylglycerol kinase, partial [Candidatus Nesterenkonia stercoripullorum]|nr:diacylglycerol kinase [Candidatus Nesterenkonia stercoripullorum]